MRKACVEMTFVPGRSGTRKASMLQEKDPAKAHSRLYDSRSVYGWISILLHWLTAIVVIALWLIGKSIMTSADIDARRELHVSIAASAWLLIVLRIVWRLRSGHPHVRGQTPRIHRIAKVTHYTMLFALLLMIVSGPLMVWADGQPIGIFGWLALPAPFGESESLREFVFAVHSNAALLLLWLVLLHIGGALKHMMFHNDDTFVRMIWPGKKALGQ